MATFAECESTWLGPPENKWYDIWVDQVLEELRDLEPPGNPDKITNEELNRLYNNQIENAFYEPSYAAEWIDMAQFPELYNDAVKWRPELVLVERTLL